MEKTPFGVLGHTRNSIDSLNFFFFFFKLNTHIRLVLNTQPQTPSSSYKGRKHYLRKLIGKTRYHPGLIRGGQWHVIELAQHNSNLFLNAWQGKFS